MLQAARTLHTTRVPLLPKLRGYFAEFLREGYLAHLSILYQPTCGGLQYGHYFTLRAKLFLAAWYLYLRLRRDSPSDLTSTFVWIFLHELATSLDQHFQWLAYITFCVLPPFKRFIVVQEYQPVVHRLRLSASP
jgi:hypothetical protein